MPSVSLEKAFPNAQSRCCMMSLRSDCYFTVMPCGLPTQLQSPRGGYSESDWPQRNASACYRKGYLLLVLTLRLKNVNMARFTPEHRFCLRKSSSNLLAYQDTRSIQSGGQNELLGAGSPKHAVLGHLIIRED